MSSALPFGQNPVGVNGPIAVTQVGNLQTVTTANGSAIINWDKLSVLQNQVMQFNQPSASSSVLNRVLNDPTVIYGTLRSNGSVWLINPAGIMVGAGGVIDTAGFVASTLNIRNEDFLAGRKLFENTPGAGNVLNQGAIRTPAGGSVYLIGSNVSNEGIIHTPGGETILAAGATVSLVDSATPGVRVEITGAQGDATNLGSITAEAGRIGIAGVVVRNSGLINASSAVSEGGRVFLRASRDAYVDGSGRIVTRGTKGGRVEVLGQRVAVMDQATIDASGAAGGGTILVGGDYQGKNPDIVNAAVTYFGPEAVLRADAVGSGDGGKVVVWADDTTRAYGSISARGGAVGGDGGLVETSGKRSLGIAGARVDTRGQNGVSGKWLLDPSDISIVYGGMSTALGSLFDPGGNTTITDGDINSALATSNVTIQTSGGSGGSGHISASGVNISAIGNNLSLLAYGGGSSTGNIQISNSAINVGNGGLTLVAGWSGSGNSVASPDGSDGSMAITDSLLHAGQMSLKSVGSITISGVNKGSWVQSQSAMEVEAANLYLNGGSNYGGATFAGGAFQFPNAGAGAMLQSFSTQTVKVSGLLRMQAGSANNNVYGGSFYGASVAISASGMQDVSAQSIQLNGGTSGHDNAAEIVGGAVQKIAIYGGSLALTGGGGAGGYNNQARVQHGQWIGNNVATGSGDQAIIVYGGGTVSLTGGSGDGTLGYYGSECYAALGASACRGSSNDTQIQNLVGNQTIDFSPGGGTLTIKGGSVGSQNWAGIEAQSGTGSQSILGNPAISLTGGDSGGTVVGSGSNLFELSNDAGIFSKGSGVQSIQASTISITGGTATVGGAGISNEGGGMLQIVTTGNLTMLGGSSNAATPYAGAVHLGHGSGGQIDVQVGGSLSVTSGSGTSAPAVIGSIEDAANVMISTGGNLTLTANASKVAIGTWAAGYGANVSLNAAGTIRLDDSTTNSNGKILVGSLSDSLSPTQINLRARNDVTIGNSGGAGVMIGVVATPGNSSSVSIQAGYGPGYGGNLAMYASTAINVDSNVDLSAGQNASTNGGISLAAGSTVYGGPITFEAGGDIDLAGSIHAGTNADITVTAGWNANGLGGTASPYGGNLVTSGSLVADGTGGIGLYAYSGLTNGLKGDISQASTGTISGDWIEIVATGDINLAGSAIANTSNILLDAGWDYAADGPSARGGDLTLASTANVYAGTSAEIYAETGQVATSRGGNIRVDGQVGSNGDISIYGDRRVTINGSVASSASGVVVWSGYSSNPDYGGDLILGPAAQLSAYGGNLEIYAVGAAEASGAITQNGGGLYSSNNVAISADGTVLLRGRVEAVAALDVFAGADNYNFSASSSHTSAYGGNVLLAGTSRLIGDHVRLYANQGQYPDGTTGHVRQGAGGVIDVTGGPLVASLDVFAAGNVEMLGAATISATDAVNVHAGYDSINSVEQAFSGRSISLNSVSTTGGIVSLYATGPIYAGLVNANTINASIANSTGGGLVIDHSGTAVPTRLSLADGATANSAVTFIHRGSDLTLNSKSQSFTTYGGTGDIFVSAPQNNLTYSDSMLDGASVILSAGGNLNLLASLQPARGLAATDYGLAAGGAINIDAPLSGNNLSLSAPIVNLINAGITAVGDAMVFGSTINIGPVGGVDAANILLRGLTLGTGNLNLRGTVGATGDLEFNLGSITAYGGTLLGYSPTSNITGFVSGDITIDSGAHIVAGNDVNLKLTGSTSTLSMLNGSYIGADWSSPPGSIWLDFSGRESGGMVISGTGSGLFVGDTSTPATATNGLHLSYAPPATTSTTPTDLTRATDSASTNKTPTDSNTPPPPSGSTGTGQGTTTTLGGTTGGTQGSFGGEETGSSGTGSTSGGQTGTITQKEEGSGSGTTTTKDKEEKKDDKKAKREEAKEEKKDDKPAQKKVAQCT